MPSIATEPHPQLQPQPEKATYIMLVTSILALALSTTGLAQVVVPAHYNKVYLTSMVDTKFVVQAKGTTTGSTVVVYVAISAI